MSKTEMVLADLAAIKRRQQEIWASGDFSRVATGQVLVGELLCEAIDARPGQRVLDVATGSGNAALSAARRFCEVTAVDWVSALLERGRERAASERLIISFREGDAENLPMPDGAFDAVLSTFGVMFAPDQGRAASELLRVCRHGGKIGLANWAPDGWVGELFRAMAHYASSPLGYTSPMRWGTEAGLQELFGDGLASLKITRRTFLFRYASPQHWLDLFRTYFGPTHQVFESLDPARQQALAADLTDIVRWFNRSNDETILLPGDYLEVVAIRR